MGWGAGKPLILYFSIAIAVTFPILPVVLCMAQNVADEYLFVSIIDPGNEPANLSQSAKILSIAVSTGVAVSTGCRGLDGCRREARNCAFACDDWALYSARRASTGSTVAARREGK